MPALYSFYTTEEKRDCIKNIQWIDKLMDCINRKAEKMNDSAYDGKKKTEG